MRIVDFNEDEESKLQKNINRARKDLLESNIDDEVKEIIDYDKEDDDAVNAKNVGKELLSLVINIAICFAVVFLITHFIGQRTVVSGSSMSDTLSDGDNLIVDRISYRFSEPERFDVIVFPFQLEEHTYYIKRIIGLPGEVVNIDTNGNIYINGKLLPETYGTETIANPGIALEPILLGPDEYFVLGDNRNNSTDSRFEVVGNIKGEDIIGKAWVRIYPFNQITFIDDLE